MQKSKNATLALIFLILGYGLLATFYLSSAYNIAYLYIINPIFWILIAGVLRIVLGKSLENRKLKKPIMEYTVIAVLVYIITYMVSGLFVTFGKNPFSTTLIGLFTNLWILGVEIVAREYIRYKLINNVYEKDKMKIAVVISIVYIIIQINLGQYINAKLTALIIVKVVCQTLLPLIAKNLLFSYTSIYCGYMPAVIYELITHLYLWLSPILPNAPWVMSAIIDSVIPIILFLYIRYVKNKLNIFRSKENIINSDPRNIIILVVLIILAIWFAVGVFPIKPVAIASGSMEKVLYVGDVAIIKKCNANDVNEGDIIEYQMQGFTVVHRIIQKSQKNGEFYFITKGDNNNSPDSDEVREDQLIGKVIYKIKYIGYPAIWLHLLQEDKQENVTVETGK